MRDPFSATQAANYWLEDCPPPVPGADGLPAAADLVVIGSGYTGLAAALEAARGGMTVVVLESGPIGHGCSTRNGGQVSSSIKPSFGELSAKHGERLAAAIRAEGRAALAQLGDLVRTHGIDCDYRQKGRYTAAHTPHQYELLCRQAETAARIGEPELIPVPRDRQLDELGSERYFGGLVNPHNASVHPTKLHAGLVRLAEQAGITLVAHCPALAIDRAGSGHEVATPKGRIAARKVLIATNGYSGPLSPWHRRRVIPIGSYILATGELDAETARRLIPTDRMVIDTRRVVIYFRLSPDGRRLLFGGRSALFENNPMKTLPRLYQMMLEVFPDLAGTPVTHTWHGTVAYTFDHLPHIGARDGIHHAMGYCGSGVSLSLYYGRKAGQQILGLAEGATALDNIPFQTRPLYGGTPWFLAPAVLGYRLADRFLP